MKEDYNLREIILVCDQWLRKKLPDPVLGSINNVKIECNNEILKNELISLGYSEINEKSIVLSDVSNCFRDHRNSYLSIIRWRIGMRVSWLDNGYKEPIPEKLYVSISFSTGPYIVCGRNGSYEKAEPIFNDMWKKIISYKPDSLDSHNHCAYFEIHKAEAVLTWNKIDLLLQEARDSYIKLIENDKNEKIRCLEEQIRRLKEEV